MQTLTRRPALRWLAPLAVLAVVAGTGVAATADAELKLPSKTAEQLLVDLQTAEIDGLSGTVVHKADLGLPALPTGGSGADASELASLLTGSHTLRVWYDGPDKARFARLHDFGETDVIVNGSDLWTWSSETKEATHATLPAPPEPGERRLPADAPTTPDEAARTVLDAIGPSTVISTDSAVEVANRPARELVLAPGTEGSLISSVRIAVDDETSVPLRVKVLDQDGLAVAEVGFTDVSFATPEARQFTFNPEREVKITEKGTLEAPEPREPSESDREAAEAAKDATEVIGEGWTTVVVTEVPADAAAEGQLAAVVESLPQVTGEWGSGRLMEGNAFSAVLTDDGRLAVGAVQPDLLYKALAK